MSMRIPCVKEGGSEMKKDYSVDEMKKRMNSLEFRPREDTTENINFGQVWQRQQY